MLIAQTFTVPMPPDEALELLTDLPRIAPCMPGATLTSSDGAIHHGRVKIKVGPIMLTYQGEAELSGVDHDLNTATLIARGTELKGSGKFGASIVMRLEEEIGTTRVHVEATLDITGRLAQFGRSAISDVSGVLVGQFVANLTRLLNSGPESPGAPDAADPKGARASDAPAGQTTSTNSAPPAATTSTADEHIDLLAVSRGALRQRVRPSPALAAFLSVVVVVLLVARRRGRSSASATR